MAYRIITYKLRFRIYFYTSLNMTLMELPFPIGLAASLKNFHELKKKKNWKERKKEKKKIELNQKRTESSYGHGRCSHI